MARSFATLKPLNVDRTAAELDLAGMARADALLEEPAADAQPLSSSERLVVNRIQDHHRTVHADVARQRAVYVKELHDLRKPLGDAAVVPEARARFQELQLRLDIAERDLETERRNLQGAEQKLEVWTAPRGIVDVPPDTNPVMTAFLLLAMIMGEGVANMMFFAEGNALGLLGAVLVAMGISAVNILGGFTAGLALVRLLNAREWWWKLAGALSLLGALASLAIGHFAAAVYRQVRHSDPAIDITAATSLVAERIRTLDVTSLDLVSMVMMGVGLVLGLFALWKGFHYGHEYPGYARRYRRMAAQEESFQDVRDDFREDFVDATDDIIETLREVIAKNADYSDRYSRLHADVTAFERRFLELERGLVGDARSLLDRYRSVNRSHRSTPPPAYFDEPFADTDAFASEPPALHQDPASVLEQARGREQEARELLADVEATHSRLRDTLRRADTRYRHAELGQEATGAQRGPLAVSAEATPS